MIFCFQLLLSLPLIRHPPQPPLYQVSEVNEHLSGYLVFGIQFSARSNWTRNVANGLPPLLRFFEVVLINVAKS